MLDIGTAAPPFTLRGQDRETVSLDQFADGPLVLVFMPFPFTSTCGGEMCDIRDNLGRLSSLDASAVVVTCDTVPSNKAWATAEEFDFPILSDFWPHGEVTRSYGAFNERLGVANRATFVIDKTGIIREVISTGSLGEARPFDAYLDALATI